MKHAIVIAHPNPDSLTCAIARTYAESARALGEEVVERDLYRMGFDPCLKVGEIPGPHAPSFRDDVVKERALLVDADVFVFVYPLWLNAAPAILKGYIDRVFGFGFGFGRAMEPLLGGKKLISFTTSGAPEAWLRDTGAFDALRTLFDSHLAGVTGMTLLDHIHHGAIVPGITEEVVADILQGVRDTVQRQFGRVAA